MTSSDIACRIAEIYSQVLFDLSLQQQVLEPVKNDLEGLEDLIKTDEQFLGVMVSPYFSSEQKRLLANRVFAGKLNGLTINFLAAMINHNRMPFLKHIITEYNRLYKKHHNYLDIHITVSRSLKPDEMQALETALSGAITSDKMILEVSVDPLIIGGIIIRYNDTIIDNSIRRRLHRAVETIIKQGCQQEIVYETRYN